jgi:hypothetical protein
VRYSLSELYAKSLYFNLFGWRGTWSSWNFLTGAQSIKVWESPCNWLALKTVPSEHNHSHLWQQASARLPKCLWQGNYISLVNKLELCYNSVIKLYTEFSGIFLEGGGHVLSLMRCWRPLSGSLARNVAWAIKRNVPFVSWMLHTSLLCEQWVVERISSGYSYKKGSQNLNCLWEKSNSTTRGSSIPVFLNFFGAANPLPKFYVTDNPKPKIMSYILINHLKLKLV